MSTTAQDLIVMAARRIGIVSRDEAMQADDAAHALAALNLMLHGWAARGANINHFDYEATTPVQVEQSLHDGIVHLLAVRLSKDFSVPLPTSDGFDYRTWWAAVQAAYFDPDEVSFEIGLTRTPSRVRTYGIR
jgi:hypothetical protein